MGHYVAYVYMYTCMPGGLLRKPPLKCALRCPRGSHNRRLCSLMWIRSGAFNRRLNVGVSARIMPAGYARICVYVWVFFLISNTFLKE